MAFLVVSLGITAQHAAKRAPQGSPMRTMKQAAELFEQQRRNCKDIITANKLAEMKATQKAEETGDWETLISEDFSLMTAGTEDVPDGTMMPGETFGLLPDELFHTPDWYGVGVYQAGGNVALNYPGFGGVLNSPMMNMEGSIRIKLRVKAINYSNLFFVSICAGGYDYPFDPVGNGTQMNMYQFDPEDGWQDIELNLVNPYTGSDCFVQINAGTYNRGGLIVDYLTVERDKDYVATPIDLSATAFKEDGFTASWSKPYGAESYLVTLYEKKIVGTDNFTSEETFENASVEDGTVTGLSQGWTASVSGTADGQYFTDTDTPDGNKALLFASDNDVLEFDADGSEILGLTLTMKTLASSENSDVTVYFELFDGTGWHTYSTGLGFIPTDEWLVMDLTQVLEGFTPGMYTKFRLSFSGIGYALEKGLSDVSEVFAADVVSCTTSPLTETTLVAEDMPADNTSMTFTGLDMNNVYSFTVKSTRADGKTSEASELFYAYGVAAPQVKEATDIDKRGAYTANWAPATNATSYKLYSYEVYTVPEDAEAHTVFEENFNKSTEGTLQSPIYLENYDHTYLDDYTDNKGWRSYGTMVCNGMVGCMENYYGTLDIISPELSVGHGDGTFEVTVEFTTLTDGTTLIVQNGNIDYQSITAETAGAHTATLKFANGTNQTWLMFYTYEGTAFLLDRVTVKQDVKAGDEIFSLQGLYDVTDGGTSARVSGLQAKSGYKFGYNVMSIYDRYGTLYTSDRSETQYVDLVTSGIDNVETGDGEAQQPSAVYDLSGRRMSDTSARGVYIIKQGNKAHKVIRGQGR